MASIKKLDTFLGKFSVQSTLLKISEESRQLFASGSPFKNISFSKNRISASTMVTQWGLAFLCCRAILVSNDGRSDRFQLNDLGYASYLFNDLDEPFLEDSDVLGFFGRISQEQFSWQNISSYDFARNYALLVEMPRKIHENYADNELEINLSSVFKKIFSLSIEEYIAIAFVIFAKSTDSSAFNSQDIKVDENIKSKEVFTEEKISAFLENTSASYQEIRALQKDINRVTYVGYERYEFNPLTKFPIVKSDNRYLYSRKYNFVIPHIGMLLRKMTGGVYWELRDYFSKQKSRSFLHDFGILFEQYVGEILKSYFGSQNVERLEIRKGINSKKHADWLVKLDRLILIFECKSSLMPLLTRQTFNKFSLLKWMNEVFIKGSTQLDASELEFRQSERFDGQKICKFLVTFEDLYFAEEDLFRSFWNTEIKERKGKEKDFYHISVRDLELLEKPIQEIGMSEIINKKEEVDALNAIRDGRGILSVARKMKNFNQLDNEHLSIIYRKFFESFLGLPNL
ncbi:hypothetical protein VB780_19525 [Leptolyngbya sp. CCNP1308]|uniref:hypothetical protein n=1 Tax=Leptolyngbya sp. CCNP1308 TaxID=3110255 RepID=UPI002B2084A3|nr:hypothetical protein [Leptolyngbya sp. CCNP1308]MEA5450780.1 hypothetical protein [Leptolyngbya sp. CCNP1308]